MSRDKAINFANALVYSLFLWCIINRLVLHWKWMRAFGHGLAILHTTYTIVAMCIAVGSVLIMLLYRHMTVKEAAWAIRNSHMIDENQYWFLMPLLMSLAGFWGCGLILLAACGTLIATTHYALRVAGVISQGA